MALADGWTGGGTLIGVPFLFMGRVLVLLWVYQKESLWVLLSQD
jgi:hypothetical protein